MARMDATETAELIAGMIGDQAYDMINEYDGEEDLGLVENTESRGNSARITLDTGRVIIVTVTTDDTNYLLSPEAQRIINSAGFGKCVLPKP